MWKYIGITLGVVLGCLCIDCSPCSGQNPQSYRNPFGYENCCSELVPGQRIRVTTTLAASHDAEGPPLDEQTITGRLRSCGDGLLVIEQGDKGAADTTIPIRDILVLQVSDGRSSNALLGAGLGFCVGLAISVATQTQHHSDEFLGGLSDMEDNLTRGAGITLGTTVLGAIIGAGMGSEKWRSVGRTGWSTSVGYGAGGDYRATVSYSF